jgi:hypothetical protein
MVQTNSSCFVIPIHTPDYKYLRKISDLCKRTSSDIFIVLTSCDNKIEKKYPLLKYIYFDRIFSGEVTNWPTQKKFYALNYLFVNFNYNYVIACDSEIKLDNLFNQIMLTGICDKIISNKKFYGGGICDSVFQEINISSMKFVGMDDSLINKYCGIYFWFSQLPVYEKNTFLDFFHDQNLINRSYSFNHFDYLLYAYWLVFKRGFEVVDWNLLENNQKIKLNCSGELIGNNEFLALLEKHNIYLYWLSCNYGSNLKSKYSIIRYHIDRVQTNNFVSNLISICNTFKKILYE